MANDTATIQLPPGYEDATPVAGPLASQSQSSGTSGIYLPPGYEDAKPVAGPLASSTSTNSNSTPSFSLKASVAGPNTALATPMSPEWSSEASGVSDIFHGNIGQGVSKIYEAEKPHVIRGSFLEKAIQKVDPSFQGSVAPDDVAAHEAQYNAPSRPLVDAAQFIDKDQHPIKKALAETASSLTSPANLSILYTTGGAGLIDNPEALAFAKRLISGGFSAAAIGNAYTHYKGFKQAIDAKNWNEAEYQITQAVTSGALGILAGRGATSDEPLATKENATKLVNPFRKAPGYVADYARDVRNGADVAQAPAQSSLRTAAESVNGKASPTSLRTALDQPISGVFSNAKSLYQKIDAASGVDFKDLNDKLENAEYQIGQSADGSPEEAKWEQSRKNVMDKIADAKQRALAAGVDPTTLDEADAKFTRARALQDLRSKVFQNPSIVQGNAAMGTPETINVDSAVRALQRLQDANKYGAPRLEQALGKDGANALLSGLYDAQRQGLKAISRQQWWSNAAQNVAKTAKVAGYTVGTAAGLEWLKNIIFGE